jgi:hypothetical protein
MSSSQSHNVQVRVLVVEDHVGDGVCRELVRDGSPSRILMLTAATDLGCRL